MYNETFSNIFILLIIVQKHLKSFFFLKKTWFQNKFLKDYFLKKK